MVESQCLLLGAHGLTSRSVWSYFENTGCYIPSLKKNSSSLEI